MKDLLSDEAEFARSVSEADAFKAMTHKKNELTVVTVKPDQARAKQRIYSVSLIFFSTLPELM